MKNFTKRGFASDNNSGIHPQILQAISKANIGHTIGYGDDIYTENAIKIFQTIFGENIDVYFVFTGTAANTLGLKAITSSYNSIICAETAHINVDECGAPEKFTGCKLIPIPTENGKITPAQIRKHLHGFGFEHHSQPKAISITQPTELGTVYTIEEIKEITKLAHEFGMRVHMDGARISNAAVVLNADFREFMVDAGIDVLSFGGTKNGMMFGEALIFFDKKLSGDFKYYRKQGMQLFSKMRFIPAQFGEFLSGDLWRKNAEHANKMAKILAAEVRKIPQIQITQPVQINAVFAIIPKEIIPILQQKYFFYVWDENKSEVRWMTSFDTTEDDIYGFTTQLKAIISKMKL